MAVASWEEAVRWYRAQPKNEQAVRNNYFDLPVLVAAQRYANSAEFKAICSLLGDGHGRRILDIGAGNGTASYAFARAGWTVVAVEPDGSPEVGAAAIAELAQHAHLPIEVVSDYAEDLHLDSNSFDVVFGRQILHHAKDLPAMLSQAARLTRDQGSLLFVREHVVDNQEQLDQFRSSHPLHHLYGGENAFTIDAYRQAARNAELHIECEWGPVETIINYFPGTERRRKIAQVSEKLVGAVMTAPVFDRIVGQNAAYLRARGLYNYAPGRLYSFLLSKTQRVQ